MIINNYTLQYGDRLIFNNGESVAFYSGSEVNKGIIKQRINKYGLPKLIKADKGA